MPLVQFLRAHTHDGVTYAPGEKTEMNVPDAEWGAKSGALIVVSQSVSALESLEARALAASKNKSCCLR